MSNLCADSIPDFSGAFNYCAPNFVFGEIEEIIVAPLELEEGEPYPADWTDSNDWDELLSPLAGDPVAFRIPVRGTIDEPERPEVDASLYRKAYPPQRYTLACSVDDLSDLAFEAMRNLNNVRVRVWFIQGHYMYGMPTGLEADITTWLTIEEGEDSMTRYSMNLTWRGTALDAAPQRIWNPFVEAPEDID
jgi:hypothetical protein